MLKRMRSGAFLVMAEFAAAGLACSPVAAASRPVPSVAIGDLPGVAPNVPWDDAPLVDLYSQYDNLGAIAINSQNFEAEYSVYDDIAADDFVVPVGTKWTITGIKVAGLYFDDPGPAASFNVRIYQDNGGKPAAVPTVIRRKMTYTFSPPMFNIKVNPPIKTPVGGPAHWWLSVQANLDFAGGAGGEWGWIDRLVQANDAAAWQNPRGGFGTCTMWDSLDNCIVTNDGPDFVWALVGTLNIQ